MQFKASILALAASAAAQSTTANSPQTINGTVHVTTVVSSFTTYCPQPTVLTFNEVCYTVTTPQVLTVTNCPCTIVTVSFFVFFF